MATPGMRKHASKRWSCEGTRRKQSGRRRLPLALCTRAQKPHADRGCVIVPQSHCVVQG